MRHGGAAMPSPDFLKPTPCSIGRAVVPLAVHDGQDDAPTEAGGFVAASAALRTLADEAPGDTVTLDWLLGRLKRRSFGMIILLLALVGLIPGVCNLAGILLMIAAVQMLLGRASPRFPAAIAARGLPARHFVKLVDRALPALRRVETMVHPRWPIAMTLLDRFSGVGILLLALVISTIPIPISNVAPALAIGLIALATLEQDGMLLVGAMALAAAMVLALAFAGWQAWMGAGWISQFL